MTPANSAELGQAIGEYLEGQRLASHFLARCRVEHVDPDELHQQIELCRAASLDRLRGFARRISKEIERGAGHATD